MDIMENGLINLAAIVGMLIFCMGLIPVILIKGTPAPPSGAQPSSGSAGSSSGSSSKRDKLASD